MGPEALRPHHATGALLVLGSVLMKDWWMKQGDEEKMMILENIIGRGRKW